MKKTIKQKKKKSSLKDFSNRVDLTEDRMTYLKNKVTGLEYSYSIIK